MGHRLPAKFRKHAAALAAANPIAFPTEDSAVKTLGSCYRRLVASPETTAVCTGGFLLRKMGDDDDIEMWVSPDVVWGRKNG